MSFNIFVATTESGEELRFRVCFILNFSSLAARATTESHIAITESCEKLGLRVGFNLCLYFFFHEKSGIIINHQNELSDVSYLSYLSV